MNLIGWVALAAAGSGALVWAWWRWRLRAEPAVTVMSAVPLPPPASRGGGTKSPAPPRPGDGRIWEFQAAPNACEQAKRMQGRRVESDNLVAVPLPGCGRTDCACRFQARTDARKNVRRQSTDRREELRFEKSSQDRRDRKDRRKPRGWSDDTYR
jgi:hypothetical protein